MLRLYRGADFELVNGQRWLVLVRGRGAEGSSIRLAVRINAGGRVAAIEVPAGFVF